ncbi:hypothetical protein DAETH_37240 (plasmid) [Deinococcus aetherius]|uniref:Uncharacterized protein n=1 Tax=Deinococcus aetherius TaxID=200252 RepID=A0ABM8AIV6_9DEIO|nr:hypothetical protein DAETH_37240 [Deinococcus aetherius]
MVPGEVAAVIAELAAHPHRFQWGPSKVLIQPGELGSSKDGSANRTRAQPFHFLDVLADFDPFLVTHGKEVPCRIGHDILQGLFPRRLLDRGVLWWPCLGRSPQRRGLKSEGRSVPTILPPSIWHVLEDICELDILASELAQTVEHT